MIYFNIGIQVTNLSDFFEDIKANVVKSPFSI